MSNENKMGKDGFCVCPKCGKKTKHKRGIPCQEEKCPQCGVKLLREGSEHHELWKQKNK
ncbi:MAG: ferredoxin [Ignavibacteriae bacterium]|nr:ferredoxin [Ignavibacteriota bacterium]